MNRESDSSDHDVAPSVRLLSIFPPDKPIDRILKNAPHNPVLRHHPGYLPFMGGNMFAPPTSPNQVARIHRPCYYCVVSVTAASLGSENPAMCRYILWTRAVISSSMSQIFIVQPYSYDTERPKKGFVFHNFVYSWGIIESTPISSFEGDEIR